MILRGRLAPGDGIVFDTGGDTNREQGGRVYEIRGRSLFFEHGRMDFAAISAGDRVWKTDDPRLSRELRKLARREPTRQRRALDMRVSGQEGGPLVLASIVNDVTYRVESTMLLEAARTRPLTRETLERQLGRLGETDWELSTLEIDLEGELIVPVSELNRMRRELVDQLPDVSTRLSVDVEASSTAPARALDDILGEISSKKAGDSATRNVSPELVVLCRTLEQLTETLAVGVETVYCDFEDPRRYREAVRLAREAGDVSIWLATPRIQKAGEQGLFMPIELAEPDGVLIRNLGGSHYFRERGLRRIADFSLNVANPISAGVLMDEGFERLTLSYDLDANQVLGLLDASPGAWFEITLHQHMPMFHMEHCIFAAFLSDGTDHTNCGRPCDVHRLHVRDRVGISHPVTADVGCRNTVFNATAQSGASYFGAFLKAGLQRFRIELLDEDRRVTRATIETYRELLAGRIETATLLERLRVHEQLGVTKGTLAVRRDGRSAEETVR
jgi:putative protease